MQIVEAGVRADDPGAGPKRGEFAGNAFLRNWREEPNLTARREVFLVLIVGSPLSIDGSLQIFTGEFLSHIDAFAESAQIVVMRLFAVDAVGRWVAKDEIQRLRGIVAEEQLERSEAGGGADVGSHGE